MKKDEGTATADVTIDINSSTGYSGVHKFSDVTPAQWGEVNRVLHSVPLDMVLHCPACGLQHIDASEPNDVGLDKGLKSGWGNPPHRSHLCHGCGHIWRPADVPTNGVKAVKTKGRNDTPSRT